MGVIYTPAKTSVSYGKEQESFADTAESLSHSEQRRELPDKEGKSKIKYLVLMIW